MNIDIDIKKSHVIHIYILLVDQCLLIHFIVFGLAVIPKMPPCPLGLPFAHYCKTRTQLALQRSDPI